MNAPKRPLDTSILHLDAMIAAGFRGHLTPRGYIRESGWPTVHPNTRDHERSRAGWHLGLQRALSRIRRALLNGNAHCRDAVY